LYITCVVSSYYIRKGRKEVSWKLTHTSSYRSVLFSAGLDEEMKLWDIRYSQAPLCTYYGHVPHSGRRLRRIHHPVFYAPNNGVTSQTFLLSGGEASHSFSMFQHKEYKNNTSSSTGASGTATKRETLRSAVFSRGTLPDDIGGDVGAIAVHPQGRLVAASVDGGDILLLAPSKQ
jgi:WD40 repeat protein